MNTFLGNVARYLYDRYGDELASLHIVVPNSRTRVFLLDELSRLIDRPVWEPRHATVDDLMRELSGYAPVDRVRAVVELYKIYAVRHAEPFDTFYFWGEMLLGDFDQIDKYRVDADMLFTNLGDLKAIDEGLQYFNEEQRAVVRRFWETFGADTRYSDQKRDFLTVWQSLSGIYHDFRKRLAEQGLAYTGMMHREAADRLRRGEASLADGRRVAVVGFNALSECEKILFDHLRDACGAEFFWDCDEYYLKDLHQEAGLFMRDNRVRYPAPIGFANETDSFRRPKRIEAVSVPSGALQCKYATDFLKRLIEQHGGTDWMPDKETAIVLTDENLLVPLLYSLPKYEKNGRPEKRQMKINVTMGYPLRQTLAYSFTDRLLRLQTHTRLKRGETAYHHADVTGLLTHPFVMEREGEAASALNRTILTRSRVYVRESEFPQEGLIGRIFRKYDDWRQVADWTIDILSAVAAPLDREESDKVALTEWKLRREYAGLIADTLRKLNHSLADCGVELDVPVFVSLARRMLQNLRVPYEGEPLQGVQVMGILETRNLDFSNVLILSMNDDNFPGNPAASSSYIPYNLRFGYGLPTPQHHDGVYAYYFYRLLQRAGTVSMVYSAKSDESSSGEPSRYIYQLEYESPHTVARVEVGLDVGLSEVEPITVPKGEAAVERLRSYLDGGGATLSPTALNTWLSCPLKFYFRYVAGLKPDDEVAEEIDMPMFGTILHKAMELLYWPLIGLHEPGEAIRRLIGSETVLRCVNEAIGEVYFHGEQVSDDAYEGELLMVHDIVVRYINGNLLPFDSRLRGFTVTALEQPLEAPFVFEAADGTTHSVVFKGLADRIDTLDDGRIRIVDYKTGRPHSDFASVEALFGSVADQRNDAVLQTLLYSYIVRYMQRQGELPGVEVCPTLYYVRMMYTADSAPLINIKNGASVTSYGPHAECFEARLRELLADLFDPARPFLQCEDRKPCEYCDFTAICRRQQSNRQK